MSAAFSADHDRRRVEIAVGDRRHDRRIDDAQRLDADHPGFRIDDGERVSGRSHLAGAGGVVGALDVVAHEGVDRLVADAVCARLDLAAAIGVEGALREDLAGQAHAGAHLDPVLGMAHVVELDPRRFGRIGRLQAHGARGFSTASVRHAPGSRARAPASSRHRRRPSAGNGTECRGSGRRRASG